MKQDIRKEENMTIYRAYKKSRSIMPKEVVNVFDLGYLAIKKDFTEQLSSIPNRKQRNMETSTEEKA